MVDGLMFDEVLVTTQMQDWEVPPTQAYMARWTIETGGSVGVNLANVGQETVFIGNATFDCVDLASA